MYVVYVRSSLCMFCMSACCGCVYVGYDMLCMYVRICFVYVSVMCVCYACLLRTLSCVVHVLYMCYVTYVMRECDVCMLCVYVSYGCMRVI